MKTRCLAGIYLLFISFTTACGQVKTSGRDNSKWKLVWSDEFNYKGLPDSTKWNYEVGYLRDGLDQYYTNKRLANTRVAGGNLIITARKEKFYNYNFRKPSFSSSYPSQFRGLSIDSVPAYIRNQHDSVANFTSGSITSKGKAEFTYGRIVVRAKLPQGQGVFPAIWMLGNRFPKLKWPFTGEIDIMEFIGNKEPGMVFGGVHFADPATGQHQHVGGKYSLDQTVNQFHIYEVDWTKEKIDLYCDNKLYLSFSVDDAGQGANNPYNKPFFFLINLALGGWAGHTDARILPQQLLIDYIRVYKQIE